MMLGLDTTQLLFLLLVAVAVGGGVSALALPYLSSAPPDDRLKAVAQNRRTPRQPKQSGFRKLIDGEKDSRRRQVQESLKQIEERERQRKKNVTLRMLITRSGLELSIRKFWLVSIALGLLLAGLTFILGGPWYAAIMAGIAGLLGVPRWFLGYLGRRRQQAFLDELAEAVDVMVRGLKAGLPLTDAMRVIATETVPPIGPEFLEVVEGQRVGITIEQGLERMFERVPLPEVSFLAILISIQSKTGGNLSEALGNLSKVLRDRKKMKAKVRSMSQEAKSSAAIIGALPFLVIGALVLMSPAYLTPLFATSTGNLILIGCGVWMLMGVWIMRMMINFDI